MAEREFVLKFLGDARGALGATKELDTSFGRIAKTTAKVTAAGAALGAGIEGLARREAERTANLRALSLETDMTEAQLRSMTKEIANHTLSLDDTIAAQQRLIKTGVSTREEFERIIPAADTISDALGIDITQAIDIADRSLSALGIPMTELEEHMDTIVFMGRQTTVSFENLGMVFRREQRNIEAAGLGFDDVAVAMAALEERGIRGPRAVMAFQTAIQDAEGSADEFWAALNLTNEELATQRSRLEDSAGMAAALAEANTSTITPLEQMKHWLDEQIFAHGALIEKSAQLAPLLIALGPALGIVTAGVKGLSLAMSFMAANPIVLVIAGIVALIAAGVLLWKNWDTVKEKAGELFRFLTSGFGRAKDAVVGAITGLLDGIRSGFSGIVSAISGAIDSIDARFLPFLALLGPLGVLAVVWRFRDQLAGAFLFVRDKVGGAIDWIIGKLEALIGKVRGALDALQSIPGAGLVSGGAGLIGDGLGAIGGFFRAQGGPVFPGTAYRVGEGGEEIFVPSAAGTIIPNAGQGAGGQGAGGGSHVFPIYIGGRHMTDLIIEGLVTGVRTGRISAGVVAR